MAGELNKKILLIAPVFFGYYKEIIAELEKMGYDVDYVCDAPSNSNVSKALGRINKSFIRIFTKRYFKNKVLPFISGKSYDEKDEGYEPAGEICNVPVGF